MGQKITKTISGISSPAVRLFCLVVLSFAPNKAVHKNKSVSGPAAGWCYFPVTPGRDFFLFFCFFARTAIINVLFVISGLLSYPLSMTGTKLHVLSRMIRQKRVS